MKRTAALLLAVLTLLAVLSGCGGSNKSWTGKHDVEIVIKDYGTVTMEIDADSAPVTASNFLNLAKKGFYNNLTVYRAIDGFAIYCGDPNKNGTGTSGETITGEFTSNGYSNPLSNVRGAVGMARGVNKNSASCQFYILQTGSWTASSPSSARSRPAWRSWTASPPRCPLPAATATSPWTTSR